MIFRKASLLKPRIKPHKRVDDIRKPQRHRSPLMEPQRSGSCPKSSLQMTATMKSPQWTRGNNSSKDILIISTSSHRFKVSFWIYVRRHMKFLRTNFTLLTTYLDCFFSKFYFIDARMEDMVIVHPDLRMGNIRAAIIEATQNQSSIFQRITDVIRKVLVSILNQVGTIRQTYSEMILSDHSIQLR